VQSQVEVSGRVEHLHMVALFTRTGDDRIVERIEL
jgi:hypothetical protein